MTAPESAEDYYARLVAAADAEGRLPSIADDAMSGWDIFPYDPRSLVVQPLQPLLDAEPARRGEDSADCWCARGDQRGDVVWSDADWVLVAEAAPVLPVELSLQPRAHHDLSDLPADQAAQLGRILVALAGAVESLPSVGRVHVDKWGDGGAHLHVFVFGRPARIGQLRGSPLVDWMEHLPPLPAPAAAANIAHVVTQLRHRLEASG